MKIWPLALCALLALAGCFKDEGTGCLVNSDCPVEQFCHQGTCDQIPTADPSSPDLPSPDLSLADDLPSEMGPPRDLGHDLDLDAEPAPPDLDLSPPPDVPGEDQGTPAPDLAGEDMDTGAPEGPEDIPADLPEDLQEDLPGEDAQVDLQEEDLHEDVPEDSPDALACAPAPEICDGLDNDCDGDTDEGCDEDGDGFCDAQMLFVDSDVARALCPGGGGDCEDQDRAIHPDAEESCDGRDNNCDQRTDEGCDDDADGFCDAQMLFVDNAAARILCPGGGGDCEDQDRALHPDAEEACDGLNNDCDEDMDEGCDDDADGFCDAQLRFVDSDAARITCWRGPGDCLDEDPQVNPGAPELCDGIDNNCNGELDQSDPAYAQLCAQQQGVCQGSLQPCLRGQPLDCQEEDYQRHAQARGLSYQRVAVFGEALCDAEDNNCDGRVDEPCGTGSCSPVLLGEATAQTLYGSPSVALSPQGVQGVAWRELDPQRPLESGRPWVALYDPAQGVLLQQALLPHSALDSQVGASHVDITWDTGSQSFVVAVAVRRLLGAQVLLEVLLYSLPAPGWTPEPAVVVQRSLASAPLSLVALRVQGSPAGLAVALLKRTDQVQPLELCQSRSLGSLRCGAVDGAAASPIPSLEQGGQHALALAPRGARLAVAYRTGHDLRLYEVEGSRVTAEASLPGSQAPLWPVLVEDAQDHGGTRVAYLRGDQGGDLLVLARWPAGAQQAQVELTQALSPVRGQRHEVGLSLPPAWEEALALQRDDNKVTLEGSALLFSALEGAPPRTLAMPAWNHGVAPLAVSTAPNRGLSLQSVNPQGRRLCAPSP